MTKRALKILLLIFILSKSYSQDMFVSDTVFLIDEVFIDRHRNFKAPDGNIRAIDSLVLNNKISANLASLLSENTSVFVKSYGSGSVASVSIRGTNASHTKLLWNDIPLNSPILGMIDMSIIPAGISNDISLHYGSSSTNIVNGAIGGVINLKTKPDFFNDFSFSALSYYGSFRSIGNSVEVKTGNKSFQSHTKLYRFGSENNFEFVNNDIAENNIQKRHNADYAQMGLLQELYFLFGSNSKASVKFWYQNMDRGVPGLTTNQSGLDNISRQYDDNAIVSASYSYYGRNNRLDLTTGANIRSLDYYHKAYIRGSGFLKTVNSESESTSIYNSLRYNHNISDLFVFYGKLGFNHHSVKSFENISKLGYDTVREEANLLIGAYTDIIKNSKFGINLRQEMIDGSFTEIMPSFFAEYCIYKDLRAIGSVSKNIRHASLNDMYYSPGGNPDLLPETAYQFDIGLSYAGKLQNINKELGATVFYGKINDWIIWRPTAMGFWQPENIDLVETKGVEFNLKLSHKLFSTVKMNYFGNYAYTSSVNLSEPFGPNDQSVGEQLPYIPIHSSNLLVRAEYRNFYLTYQWNYYSERYTGSAAEPGLLVSLYPYYMNDVGIGTTLQLFSKSNLNLSFNVHNLFDENYRSVLWQPMPGRNYRLQAIFSF